MIGLIVLLLIILIVALSIHNQYKQCKKGTGGVFDHICHLFV